VGRDPIPEEKTGKLPPPCLVETGAAWSVGAITVALMKRKGLVPSSSSWASLRKKFFLTGPCQMGIGQGGPDRTLLASYCTAVSDVFIPNIYAVGFFLLVFLSPMSMIFRIKDVVDAKGINEFYVSNPLIKYGNKKKKKQQKTIRLFFFGKGRAPSG